jgi:hypothetical protein
VAYTSTSASVSHLHCPISAAEGSSGGHQNEKQLFHAEFLPGHFTVMARLRKA